jgi:hypothetical protein
MGYTTPSTAVSFGTLTTNMWNNQVRDNLNYLNTWGTTLAGASGTVVNVTATQGSVVATQGSVANIVTQPIGTAIGTAATAGSTYVLTTADSGKLLMCAGTASGTVQIPLNATQPFAIGQKVDFAQMGTGTVTVTVASGGTLDSTPSAILRTKYSAASVIKINTNEWLLMGDLY